MSVAPDLSPSWVLAAAQTHASRLNTLSHALQLNPQMVGIIKDKIPQKSSPDMVRTGRWSLSTVSDLAAELSIFSLNRKDKGIKMQK